MRLKLDSLGMLETDPPIDLPIDSLNPELVGVQISADGKRLWVCINGQSVLRVKGCKHKIEVEQL